MLVIFSMRYCATKRSMCGAFVKYCHKIEPLRSTTNEVKAKSLLLGVIVRPQLLSFSHILTTFINPLSSYPLIFQFLCPIVLHNPSEVLLSVVDKRAQSFARLKSTVFQVYSSKYINEFCRGQCAVD